MDYIPARIGARRTTTTTTPTPTTKTTTTAPTAVYHSFGALAMPSPLCPYLCHDLLLLLLVSGTVVHLLHDQRLAISLSSDLSNDSEAAPSQGLQDVELIHALTSRAKAGRATEGDTCRESGGEKLSGFLQPCASSVSVQLLYGAVAVESRRCLVMPGCLFFSELFFVCVRRLSNLKLVGHATTTDSQSRERGGGGSDTVARWSDSGSGGGAREAWLGPCWRRVELQTLVVVSLST